MKTKKLMAAVAVALTLCVTIGGTLAWLTDSTEEVKNTFTVGNVDIDLTESNNLDLKMVPGKVIAKNPTVSVDAGSEDCWLFVEVTESDNLDSFIEYGIADGWVLVDGTDNVYYRTVKATDTTRTFSVLKTGDEDDEVIVKSDVTKEMMDGIKAGEEPTLSFVAYAVQETAAETAAAAWAIAKQ